MSTTKLPESGFIRLKTILKFFPVSASHWWEKVKSGEYPQPIKLSPKVTVWRAEEIHALIDRCSQDSIEKKPSEILNYGGDNEYK